MARLIIHVGPHKSGTTSIQHALHLARDDLAADGILYPPSVVQAHFPEQHSDLAFLVKANEIDQLRQYFQGVFALADERQCPVILLSGEEFSSLVNNDAFVRLVKEMRQHADVDLIFVKREIREVIRSNIMQQVLGNVFALARYAGNLDEMITNIYRWIVVQRGFFAEMGARFLEFEELVTHALPAYFVEKVTARKLTYLAEYKSNSTEKKLNADPLLLLSTPLRLLIAIKEDQPVDSPACYREAASILANSSVEREPVNALLREFHEHLMSRVDAVLEDLQ